MFRGAIEGVDGYYIQCNTSNCKQICDARTCIRTKIQQVNSLTDEQECDSDFNYGTLNASNVIVTASATTTEFIQTQPSTAQGKVNYQTFREYHLKDKQTLRKCM